MKNYFDVFVLFSQIFSSQFISERFRSLFYSCGLHSSGRFRILIIINFIRIRSNCSNLRLFNSGCTIRYEIPVHNVYAYCAEKLAGQV